MSDEKQYELDDRPPPLNVSGSLNGGLDGKLSGSVALGPLPPAPPPWWRDVDWAPFVRLFNHVREQLPDRVEQAADWLSNLPGSFRERVPARRIEASSQHQPQEAAL